MLFLKNNMRSLQCTNIKKDSDVLQRYFSLQNQMSDIKFFKIICKGNMKFKSIVRNLITFGADLHIVYI